jgi:hypothetical protein
VRASMDAKRARAMIDRLDADRTATSLVLQ